MSLGFYLLVSSPIPGKFGLLCSLQDHSLQNQVEKRFLVIFHAGFVPLVSRIGIQSVQIIDPSVVNLVLTFNIRLIGDFVHFTLIKRSLFEPAFGNQWIDLQSRSNTLYLRVCSGVHYEVLLLLLSILCDSDVSSRKVSAETKMHKSSLSQADFQTESPQAQANQSKQVMEIKIAHGKQSSFWTHSSAEDSVVRIA